MDNNENIKIGERLYKARKNKDMTRAELGKFLNLHESTIKRYEDGEIKSLDISKLKDFAFYLDVSPAWLMGWSDIYTSQIIGEDTISYKPIQRGKTVPIPLIGKIPAGQPIEALENIEGYIDVPESEVSNGNYFYLKVTGDSMIGSRICEGDLVLVRKQPDVENGEIAVVRVNSHDATLKRVKKMNGTIILYPDNPKYQPIIINEDSAEIIGKVVKVEFAP